MSCSTPFLSNSDRIKRLTQSFESDNAACGEPDDVSCLLQCALSMILGLKKHMWPFRETVIRHFQNDTFRVFFGSNQAAPALTMAPARKSHSNWELLRVGMSRALDWPPFLLPQKFLTISNLLEAGLNRASVSCGRRPNA